MIASPLHLSTSRASGSRLHAYQDIAETGE